MPAQLTLCRIQPIAGQHQLVATRAVMAGEPLLIEAPLMTVAVGAYRWGTYNWDFVDRLLTTPALLHTYDRWKLAVTEFFLDPLDLHVEAELMRRHRLSRQRIRSLFFSIATNNIGMLDAGNSTLHSYGLFEMMSRSNHSCEPSARLASAGDGSQMALVARRDLRSGDPVTWSYFRESEFLHESYEVRNFGLVNNFRFHCGCPRCQREMPSQLRQVKDLVAYFDEHIRREARALSASPEGRAQIVASTPLVQHRRALQQYRGGTIVDQLSK